MEVRNSCVLLAKIASAMIVTCQLPGSRHQASHAAARAEPTFATLIRTGDSSRRQQQRCLFNEAQLEVSDEGAVVEVGSCARVQCLCGLLRLPGVGGE